MPVGLTRDAGWEIGVSKTLPLPVAAVWDFLMSPEGLSLWFGPGAALPVEGDPALRSLRPRDRVRLSYGETVLQVAVSPAGDGRTVLTFHQEHMASAEERERQRAHWKGVMAEIVRRVGE
ncbi:SRPBCC domain-containing protein [Streptomyces sp. NBC_01255]|uniref:SRPBCC family protein n=1 Tax=Streptomyces sp. NBC_01255 TaxID=2903798 RepID=UPI002E2F7142|nr:SRPBCC domain-containing protein [Streptomyces sp. NBC_01255]